MSHSAGHVVPHASQSTAIAGWVDATGLMVAKLALLSVSASGVLQSPAYLPSVAQSEIRAISGQLPPLNVSLQMKSRAPGAPGRGSERKLTAALRIAASSCECFSCGS